MIERAVNGGDYATLATLTTLVTSYADTTTSANNYYSYRIKATNTAGSSAYATSGTTYNTPAAPTGITGVRTSSTALTLSVTNEAENSASTLYVEYSTDQTTWSSIGSYAASKRTTQTLDLTSMPTATLYFRAYNTSSNGLQSAYSDICTVQSLTQPLAPTLTAPKNGAVVDKTAGTITLAWVHNPVDGSAQTAATIEVSTDSWSTSTSYSVTTASSYSLSLSSFANATTVSWRVKTKGAASEYSPYATASFKVYTAPTVSITQPGTYVTALPATVTASVSDDNGISGAYFQISKDGVTKYFRESTGTVVTTFQISQEDFLIENNATYEIVCTVRSKSGLEATATKTFTTAFPEPQSGTVDVDNNQETGITTITVGVEEDESKATPDSISLYRVYGDEEVLLASGIQPGTALIDKFTPLNTRYTYKVITYVSSTGAVHVENIEGFFESPFFFFFWNNEKNVAKARWNASETITWEQPDQTQIYYAGRTFPVNYNNANRGESRSFTALLETQEELDSFRKFWLAGGNGLYKSGDGSVFYAASKIRFTHLYKAYAKGTIAVDLVRIDGQVK